MTALVTITDLHQALAATSAMHMMNHQLGHRLLYTEKPTWLLLLLPPAPSRRQATAVLVTASTTAIPVTAAVPATTIAATADMGVCDSWWAVGYRRV